ncbi:MAG: FAD-dependent oxidoreductase [Chloroflexi bacterium]|nr:FAD-dependent oxidoreductase [Chloroflexota bacterium]
MDHTLGSADTPVRIAIVGAGPAAFYAVEALLKSPGLHASIDLFNRLPTPFGLVRDGVAPDHQSIKAVTRIYERLAEQPPVRYFGNVTVGRDVLLADLQRHYDQTILAVGAPGDRQMEIPGEALYGSAPATAFVGWYNGHPDYRDLAVDLSHERVVVVGNGNVAMDVARILVRDVAELAQTDIADHALAALRTSHVREVVVLGRRGPAQAAFTNAEIREFGELDGVDIVIDPADLVLDPLSAATLDGNRVAAANVRTLHALAERGVTGQPRRIVMRFLTSPTEVLGDAGRVCGVRVERNALVPDAAGNLTLVGTGAYDTIAAGMVLRSIGYRGVPLPGVPFDARRAVIPNVDGRVTDGAGGAPIAGLYVVGWAKRGPSGVIGTNKPDSIATVASMLADLPHLPRGGAEERAPAAIERLLEWRQVTPFGWDDWRKLDAHERERGAEAGRPRIKVTRVAEMLDLVGKAHVT